MPTRGMGRSDLAPIEPRAIVEDDGRLRTATDGCSGERAPVIPTLIVFGIVLGRWWAPTVVFGAIFWPALLQASDAMGVEPGLLAAAGLGAVNAAVGVLAPENPKVPARYRRRDRNRSSLKARNLQQNASPAPPVRTCLDHPSLTFSIAASTGPCCGSRKTATQSWIESVRPSTSVGVPVKRRRPRVRRRRRRGGRRRPDRPQGGGLLRH